MPNDLHPNDVIAALQQQRESALNATAMLQAQIAALRRTLAERDSRIKTLEGEVEKLTPTEVAA